MPTEIQHPMATGHIKTRSKGVVEVDVKKKDRLEQLEQRNRELQEQLDNQGEILQEIAKRLAKLGRDVSHLLPEK